MLYLSTRNSQETYTAARVLTEARAPDGGLFVPFFTSAFPGEDLRSLSSMKFNEAVARMMNIQFQTRLTEHDVRLCVGKSPVRLAQLNNRLLVGECWHNLHSSYSRLVHNLSGLIGADTVHSAGSWTEVGIGICVLFGIFAELMGRGLVSFEKKADVSAVSGDFSMVMSCWYARAWGLPIENIVCCCNENNGVWNLFSNGALRTDGVSIPTATPDADICVPVSLERLIHGCGGVKETADYVEKCRLGATYYPEEPVLSRLQEGMYVSVVSSRRMLDTIPNAHATHGYLLSPYSALAYAGLMDFRAKRGGSRAAILLADRSPLAEPETVAAALGISEAELKEKFE